MFLKSITFLIFIISFSYSALSLEQTYKILNSEDDAEELIENSALSLTSSDLELGEDYGPQIVGLLFKDLGIPKNSIIHSAKLRFISLSNHDKTTNLEIKIENSANPNNINQQNKLSQREYLPSVKWDNVQTWYHNSTYYSIDFSNSLKQLLTNPELNWDLNSDILIAISGEGKRTAYSYDKDFRYAPKLVIEYTPIDYLDLVYPNNNSVVDSTFTFKWDSDFSQVELYLGESKSNFNIINGKTITNEDNYQVTDLNRGKKYFWKLSSTKNSELFETQIDSFIVSYKTNELKINELMASNLKSSPEFYDFDDFPDWIELHNPTDKYFDLSDLSISDDNNNLNKWSFPENTYMLPNSYITLWADDLNINKNNDTIRPWWPYNLPFKTTYYHLNFKLSKEGESVFLSDNNNIIDSVIFENQYTDISYGRNPITNNWEYITFPTPSSKNSSISTLNRKKLSPPTFSNKPGYYTNPFQLEINSNVSDSKILYTTDGSYPNQNSEIYTTPITIDENKVIHAIVIHDNLIGSEITSAGYLFERATDSITTIHLYGEKKYLFDENIGIYTNTLKEREVPVNMDIIEKNNVYNFNVGTKIGGENIFRFPQKPLNIYTDKDYGTESLDYQIFEDKRRSKFDRLYLRNAGDDWPNTFILDAFQRELVKNHIKNPTQAYKPAVIYINGDYYGIHNLREKITEDYFIQNYEAKPGEIDLLEADNSIIYGDNTDFINVRNFIMNENMSNSDNYNYVKEQINIESYIDFLVAQIYIVNTSMRHNREYFRNRAYKGKWEWVLVDLDRGFNPGNSNQDFIRSIYTNEDYLFGFLCNNDEFKNEFIKRYNLFLNTIFVPEKVESLVDKMADKIKPLMQKHIEKWAKDSGINSIQSWEANLNNLKRFAQDRHPIAITNFKNLFNLDSEIKLSINKIGNGAILLDEKIIDENTLNINYQKDGNPLELDLQIIPEIGYKIKTILGYDKNQPKFIINSDTVLTVIFESENINIIPKLIEENIILEKNQTYYAPHDIIIPENKTMTIEEGVKIKFSDYVSLIDHGELIIRGTKTNPVIFEINKNANARIPLTKEKYKSNKWGSLIIESATDTAKLSNLIIRDASTGKNSKLHKAALSINKSILNADNLDIEAGFPIYAEFGSIKVKDSKLYSDETCDYINIKYADEALVDNCDFRGNFAFDTDAIDYDNISSGTISNNIIYNFQGFNSDGIDIGELAQNILITDNFIYNCIDKGVSIGQGSSAILKNNIITACSQGLAIKDEGSYAEVINNTFYKNNISVACFEKNLDAGGGKANIINNISYKAIISDYFFDEYSNIDIAYSLSDSYLHNGKGNLLEDPNMQDPENFDFKLKDNSTCIDRGDPNILDTDGTISDIGAFNYNKNIPLDIIPEYKLFINEVSANNPKDSTGEDWFELYNDGDTPINLGNLYLSDDETDFLKFRIDAESENMIINPKSFLYFIADDKLEEGENHTNFKLSTNGETIYLSSKDGNTLIDEFSYFEHEHGRTVGRYPDGSNNIVLLYPTPNYKNSLIPNSVNLDTLIYFITYPNPVVDNLFIKLSGKRFTSFKLSLYNLNSEKILEKEIIEDTSINFNNLSKGIYIIYAEIDGHSFFRKIVTK